jgi:hypothetical protein
MKKRHYSFLKFLSHTDQQILADNHVYLGKWRIHDNILRSKDDHFSDFFADPVSPLILDKECIQPFLLKVSSNIVWVKPGASFSYGIVI